MWDGGTVAAVAVALNLQRGCYHRTDTADIVPNPEDGHLSRHANIDQPAVAAKDSHPRHH